jgi:PAS domain S-box-containing protein
MADMNIRRVEENDALENAKKLLSESEQRFQKMLSVVPDMISIQSPEMDILYSNWQGFATVPENRQKANTKCYKTYRNLDSVCPDCLAKSVLETRKPFKKEVQLPDGTWHDIRVIPFLDENNNVEMFMEWVRDITVQKKAEEALKNNYALLHIAGKTARIGGWDVDLETNISHWSDVVAEIHEVPHGYAPSVSKGINFYAPKWRDKIIQVYNDCAQRGIPYDEEMEIITSNGKRVWVRTIGEAIKDQNGKIIGLQGSFQDISQRKEMEESLRKSENLFKRVFEILPIGLWIADKNGTLLQGNPAGVKIWGMEPKVGQSEYGVFKAKRLPSGKEIEPNDWALAHTVNHGLTTVDELLEIDAFDGLKKIIVNYTTPILDDQGSIEGAVVVNRDITERYQAEEELKSIEWMLSKKTAVDNENPALLYGDLSELNTNRLILDAVGKDVLKDIAGDFMGLLETSSAIYEKNGDYAQGIFASSWCQFMDQASRELCGTDDNKEALHCGKWLCHESCWKKASEVAMDSNKPVDIECEGGIHLYAVPIIAGNEVVGAINIGYGNPPRDEETVRKIAEKYNVPLEELIKKAKEYKSRPPYIIEIAKDRLQASANLIGEIVSRKIAQKELLKLNEQLEKKIAEKTQALNERVSELERFHDATIQREFRIKELREEIEQLKRNQK